MKVSAKADYAVRAAAELAAAQHTGAPVRAETIATAQGIPQRFLENILSDLRHAGLVQSVRGAEGGHRLNRPAAEITVADVIRAVDGPLAAVRGERPGERDLRRARPSRSSACGSRCARTCARSSSTSRSPISPRGALPRADRRAGRRSGGVADSLDPLTAINPIGMVEFAYHAELRSTSTYFEGAIS